MNQSDLIKLQGLLVDDICRLASHITNMSTENLPTSGERMGRYLYRSLANRRVQLSIVNDLLQGKEPRSKMPIDWR